MPLAAAVLIASLFGSVVALVGGLILLWREAFARRIAWPLVAFAAGALLAVSLLDLLPEAIEAGAALKPLFATALAGIILFFLLERILLWHHAHHGQEPEVHPYTWLLLIGDAIHNFVDGLAIAAAFLISVPLGVTTAISVFFHEVPQEIGDFGVMLHGGMKRATVFWANFTVALATPLGALLTLAARHALEPFAPYLLAFAAGSFIYIAGADLIPELSRRFVRGERIGQILSFLLGIVVIVIVGALLHE